MVHGLVSQQAALLHREIIVKGIFVYYKMKDIDEMADLPSLKVGAVKGYSGWLVCRRAGVSPIAFDSYEMAVEALGEGKLDAIVMDEMVVLYYRKKLGLLDKIEWGKGQPIVNRTDMTLPVKKGNKTLLSILNKGVVLLAGSDLQRIRERWLR